jgi:hypothetical protein
MRSPTQEQSGTLIAIAAIIFGGWVRLVMPWLAGFPINDGGLFYVMVQAIQNNGLRIPPSVHYNGMDIPFAYPPLGLYAGALASSLFHVDAIRVLQWLPAIVLIATLPAFYMLAKVVLDSDFKAGLATLMYAFTPRAITWQIMGGGLTRSFGQLFLILAAACIYMTFASYNRKRLALSVLFSALVVLTHPEAALQTVGIAVVLWMFKGRSKASTLHAAAIGAGTLIVSSIWWLPLALGPGLGMLLSAGQTGLHSGYALLQPFLLNFVDEPLMTLVAVLGLLGFAFEASRRRFLLPIWFLLPFVVEPRSAPTVAMIPLAIMAGISLSEVVLPSLAGLDGEAPRAASENVLRGRAVPVFLLFISLYMLGDTAYFGSQIAGSTLPPSSRAAFDWIKSNTPPDSRFLVLTGSQELFCDSAQEWFPALTGRVSITTIQGREWMDGADFSQFAADSQSFQGCLSSTQPLGCIEKLASGSAIPIGYDYMFLARNTPIFTACRATDTSMRAERLIAELNQDPRYSSVYATDDAAIFQRRP